MYVMRYPKFSILYNKFREARKIQKLDFVQLNKPSFFAFFAHILRILLFVLRIFCAFYARVLLCNKPSLTLLGETYIWFTKYTKYGDYGIVYRDHTCTGTIHMCYSIFFLVFLYCMHTYTAYHGIFITLYIISRAVIFYRTLFILETLHFCIPLKRKNSWTSTLDTENS